MYAEVKAVLMLNKFCSTCVKTETHYFPLNVSYLRNAIEYKQVNFEGADFALLACYKVSEVAREFSSIS